ncbi:hypothetical protein CLAIMM_02248 isoform 1 [Cladophialophora immunda]|nr:hypothetical protein CLAIMM_02248 isoform 1 [Cladophialophora immunda]
MSPKVPNYRFSRHLDREISTTESYVDKIFHPVRSIRNKKEKIPVRPASMSESGMHAVTNGKAEKVSDGLPNGTETNDLESVQIDSVDSGRFNTELHVQVQTINQSMNVTQTAVAKLTEMVDKYGEMVKTVEERYSAGQDLEEKLQDEKNLNETLVTQMEKLRQGHRVQLRNLGVQHEKQLSRLKSQAESGKAEREKYEKMIEALKKEQETAMLKSQRDLEMKRDQLEKDNEEKITRLEAAAKGLEEERTKLKRELEDMTKLRDLEIQTHETMQGKADAKIQDLEQALTAVKAKYEVERQPDEHYTERYKGLVDSVASIADEYFSELPEEAEEDPAGIHKQLKKKRSTFDVVPITDSPCARVLRLAFVQNIIFNAIRDTVWPPFFSRHLWKNKKDRSLIHEIYLRLSADGEEIQNDWRVSTVKVLDRLDNGVDVGDKIGVAIDLNVIQILEPLLGEKNKVDFRSELKKIFTTAMELGQESWRDRSPVSFDFSPSVDGGKGWKEFSEGLDLEDAPNPSLGVCRESAFEPLCVSPRLYRKRDTATVTPDQGEELVHPGVALFPKTGIFQQGLLEWQVLRQAEREYRKAYNGNGKARRASIASTTNGFSPAPPPLDQMRPSKTWASHTSTEYD